MAAKLTGGTGGRAGVARVVLLRLPHPRGAAAAGGGRDLPILPQDARVTGTSR